MKNMKKLLILLMSICLLSGCGNKECNCPKDNITEKEEYQNLIEGYSDIYQQVATSVVKIEVRKIGNNTTTGSGVVFFQESGRAYILTNAHVVLYSDSTYTVEVKFSDKNGNYTGESEIVASDKIYKSIAEDVAVLEIPESDKYTVANHKYSSELNRGDFVFAVGSPFGKLNQATAGYISSYNTPVELTYTRDYLGYSLTSYAIIPDLTLNKGNSGGGLFDKDGNLIGITTGIEDDNNMKICLTYDHVEKIAKTLITGKSYTRPNISITLKSIPEMGSEKDDYGIYATVKEGVYILSSNEGNEQLTSGHIISEVNGMKISSLDDFWIEILKYNVGDTVTFKILNKNGTDSGLRPQVVLHQ